MAWRAPPAPAPVAARPADERARRAEALARALVAEVELLRGLLAAAVRRHSRRKAAPPAQLELPLP